MSYDMFFVRRDPGQSFEDALDELEGSFERGDPGELSDTDLEHWAELLPLAREILGEVDVSDEDSESLDLVGRSNGVALAMIAGEVAIHVPDDRRDIDSVELMGTVYELARAVEDVTGLEGYDPQLGEPVSARIDDDAPMRRRWPDDVPDDEEEAAARAGVVSRTRVDVLPTSSSSTRVSRRRWWEFWRA